jgi:flagellar biosynthesis/type III secretory pathway protein FliH
MTRVEYAAYHDHFWQLSHQYSMIQTSKTEGREEGLAKGMAKGLEESLAKGLAKGRKEGLAKDEKERKKLQEALAQKDEALAQKDEALARQNSMIANAVKNLVGQGMSPGQIAQILQLDVEEVRKNI